MADVIVWSKENCPYCEKAKFILTNLKVPFEERKIGESWSREQLLEVAPNARTVPQIFISGRLIGGCDDFEKYIEATGWNGTGFEL